VSTPTTSPTTQLQTRGSVTPQEADYARAKVAAAVQVARDPVLHVRVRLTVLADPALERPALAQVNVDLNGRPVRAQAARPTLTEAVDEVQQRLRDRLLRSAGDWQAIRGSRPVEEPHEWRHESLPAERPAYFPRPVEERQVVRHKTFTVGRATVEEAAFDRDMLGYAFHLFTEDGSGVDSVLYDAADGSGLRLAQVDPRPELVTPGEVPVAVSPHPAPQLSVEGATARLGTTGWPFVFFRDAASGRGAVAYHRYDGDYGLLVPAT
jgi:ribosome-associated translation inhibitor RaiA